MRRHVKFIQDFPTGLMEFSFSRTTLSAWWESTAAFASTSCRSSHPEVFCRPTFFDRTPLTVASEHESQASTLIAGKEQEEEFSDSPHNENINEEEENSTKQTNNKFLEDELDIELFVHLVRQFPSIFKEYSRSFLIVCRLIDFALVVLKLLVFKFCVIILA